MLTSTSLAVPVSAGRMVLGTWQALYLIEHRSVSDLPSYVVRAFDLRTGTLVRDDSSATICCTRVV